MARAHRTLRKRISQAFCDDLRSGANLFPNAFPMRFRTRAALPAHSVEAVRYLREEPLGKASAGDELLSIEHIVRQAQ